MSTISAVEQNYQLALMSVERVDFEGVTVETRCGDGGWVAFEDYEAGLKSVRDAYEADLAICRGDTPLSRDDAATKALLQNILDIVAEVEDDPAFAGFQIQEARNAAGQLISIRLMPCDNHAGVVAPRSV